jgi:hypothetical protein
MFESLVHPTLVEQRPSEIEVAVERLGVDADALPQMSNGLVQPATIA